MRLNLDDEVKIIPFEGIKGIIIGIYLSNAPFKYYVRYFMDSKISEEYFYEDELK